MAKWVWVISLACFCGDEAVSLSPRSVVLDFSKSLSTNLESRS